MGNSSSQPQPLTQTRDDIWLTPRSQETSTLPENDDCTDTWLVTPRSKGNHSNDMAGSRKRKRGSPPGSSSAPLDVAEDEVQDSQRQGREDTIPEEDTAAQFMDIDDQVDIAPSTDKQQRRKSKQKSPSNSNPRSKRRKTTGVETERPTLTTPRGSQNSTIEDKLAEHRRLLAEYTARKAGLAGTARATPQSVRAATPVPANNRPSSEHSVQAATLGVEVEPEPSDGAAEDISPAPATTVAPVTPFNDLPSRSSNSRVVAPSSARSRGTPVTQNSRSSTGTPLSTDGLPNSGAMISGEIATLEVFMEQYKQDHQLDQFEVNERLHDNSRDQSDTVKELWEEIYNLFPNRQRSAVRKQCRRKYHNYPSRGKWTEDEDELLKDAYEASPSKWVKIGGLVGRMPEDCRDRWRNYLSCGTNRKTHQWSEKEEATLSTAVERCADELRKEAKRVAQEKNEQFVERDWESMVNFSVVSDRMGGSRSRLQCLQHWQALKRRDEEANDNLDATAQPRIIPAILPKKRNWRHRRSSQLYLNEMKVADKIEILGQIGKSGALRFERIPWMRITQNHPDQRWTSMDRKVALHKMMRLLDGPRETLKDTIDALIDYFRVNHADDIVQPETDSDVEEVERRTPRRKKLARSAEMVVDSSDRDEVGGEDDGDWEEGGEDASEDEEEDEDDRVKGGAEATSKANGHNSAGPNEALSETSSEGDSSDDEEDGDDTLMAEERNVEINPASSSKHVDVDANGNNKVDSAQKAQGEQASESSDDDEESEADEMEVDHKVQRAEGDSQSESDNDGEGSSSDREANLQSAAPASSHVATKKNDTKSAPTNLVGDNSSDDDDEEEDEDDEDDEESDEESDDEEENEDEEEEEESDNNVIEASKNNGVNAVSSNDESDDDDEESSGERAPAEYIEDTPEPRTIIPETESEEFSESEEEESDSDEETGLTPDKAPKSAKNGPMSPHQAKKAGTWKRPDPSVDIQTPRSEDSCVIERNF